MLFNTNCFNLLLSWSYELPSSKGMQHKSSILYTIALWSAQAFQQMNCVTCSQQFCFSRTVYQAVLPRGAVFIISGTEYWPVLVLPSSEKMERWEVYSESVSVYFRQEPILYIHTDKTQYLFTDKQTLVTVQLSVHGKSGMFRNSFLCSSVNVDKYFTKF